MSFIGMRKHMFTLPKQVSKNDTKENKNKQGNIYTVGGGTDQLRLTLAHKAHTSTLEHNW